MKILFVLGARSEWGYIKPILVELKKKNHKAGIFACHTSIINRFGNLISEIEADGFEISGKFFTAFDGDNKIAMAKSIGSVINSATDFLSNNNYDWVIVSGDRVEQLGFTIAAAVMYIPIAHVQAGERSGNIDGVSRHAIARFAHLHLASNQDAADRLIASGEDEKRVFITGAPQLDELISSEVPSVGELLERSIILEENFIVAVVHGSTDELDLGNRISTLISALLKQSTPIIWIAANNDDGKYEVENQIKKSLRRKDKFFANLNRLDYLSLLQNCKFIIGNSSSGILEAPTFGIPAINLGIRQSMRLKGTNVIDCDFNENDILKAITTATSIEFRKISLEGKNPYGDGGSSRRIIDILEKIKPNHEFLLKQITY
jgi:GDP/UDP-N,N'-diacetylbacillosamine 2-epimerase (hydrolysing)